MTRRFHTSGPRLDSNRWHHHHHHRRTIMKRASLLTIFFIVEKNPPANISFRDITFEIARKTERKKGEKKRNEIKDRPRFPSIPTSNRSRSEERRKGKGKKKKKKENVAVIDRNLIFPACYPCEEASRYRHNFPQGRERAYTNHGGKLPPSRLNNPLRPSVRRRGKTESTRQVAGATLLRPNHEEKERKRWREGREKFRRNGHKRTASRR